MEKDMFNQTKKLLLCKNLSVNPYEPGCPFPYCIAMFDTRREKYIPLKGELFILGWRCLHMVWQNKHIASPKEAVDINRNSK